MYCFLVHFETKTMIWQEKSPNWVYKGHQGPSIPWPRWLDQETHLKPSQPGGTWGLQAVTYSSVEASLLS